MTRYETDFIRWVCIKPPQHLSDHTGNNSSLSPSVSIYCQTNKTKQNQADFPCSVRRLNTQMVQKSPFSVGQYKTKFAVVCCKIPPPPPPPPYTDTVSVIVSMLYITIYMPSLSAHTLVITYSTSTHIVWLQRYQWYRNYKTDISGTETVGLVSVVQKLRGWY